MQSVRQLNKKPQAPREAGHLNDIFRLAHQMRRHHYRVIVTRMAGNIAVIKSAEVAA